MGRCCNQQRSKVRKGLFHRPLISRSWVETELTMKAWPCWRSAMLCGEWRGKIGIFPGRKNITSRTWLINGARDGLAPGGTSTRCLSLAVSTHTCVREERKVVVSTDRGRDVVIIRSSVWYSRGWNRNSVAASGSSMDASKHERTARRQILPSEEILDWHLCWKTKLCQLTVDFNSGTQINCPESHNRRASHWEWLSCSPMKSQDRSFVA